MRSVVCVRAISVVIKGMCIESYTIGETNREVITLYIYICVCVGVCV